MDVKPPVQQILESIGNALRLQFLEDVATADAA